jgi:hypothetical protein
MPACPTFAELPAFSFRANESARKHIEWLDSHVLVNGVAVPAAPVSHLCIPIPKLLCANASDPQARKKVGPVDMLGKMTASGAAGRKYLVERMKAWVTHVYVEVNTRGRLLRSILSGCSHRSISFWREIGPLQPSRKPTMGSGLRSLLFVVDDDDASGDDDMMMIVSYCSNNRRASQILIDWSEKLSLEPNNGATGAQYKAIGVLVAVCLRKVKGKIAAETVIGFFDDPNNDVPHTHAFLVKVLEHYVREARAAGTCLRVVNIWSDGGQNHFKSAEAFLFTTHLRRVLQNLVGVEVVVSMTWSFMQSYHGKGPYDAEGGVIKYCIRLQIREQGFAFAGAFYVHAWCIRSERLCRLAKTRPGVRNKDAAGAMFAITRRLFFLISEADVCSRFCTSPAFKAVSCRGSGDLLRKMDIFCFRPRLNPVVRVMRCLPAHLGLPLVMGEAGGSSEPYSEATLNYIGREPMETGIWRRFSCTCDWCLFGEAGDAEIDATGCVFYGAGRAPPSWVSFQVVRSPGVPTKSKFLGLFCDFMLASPFQGDGAARRIEIAEFIRTVLHRFRGQAEVLNFVTTRFKATGWVKAWLRREKDEVELVPGAEAQAHVLRSRALIVAHLQRCGWQLRWTAGQAVATAEELHKFIDEFAMSQ